MPPTPPKHSRLTTVAYVEALAGSFIGVGTGALMNGDIGQSIPSYVIGALLFVGGALAGIFWNKLRTLLGESIFTSLYKVSSDFRWWAALLMVIFLYVGIGVPITKKLPSRLSDEEIGATLSPHINYFSRWGGTPNIFERVDVSANGNLLLSFAEKYNVAAAALHYAGTEDIKETELTLRGTERTIARGEIILNIPTNEKYIDEWKQGIRRTTYVLLLIPKGKKLSSYNTIRQLETAGGIYIQDHGGPP